MASAEAVAAVIAAGGAHDRFARSEVGKHAERLRALSGEDESEVWLVHGRFGSEKERR